MDLPQLPARPECRACELHAGCTSVGTPTVPFCSPWPRRPDAPVVIMLGQNPGLREDQAGLPFVGPSGRLVRQVYVSPSMAARGYFYLSNTARCFTPTESPPRQRHYNACFPYTVADLKEILRCHLNSWRSSGTSPAASPSSPASPSSGSPPGVAPLRAALVCLGAPAVFTAWRCLTGKGRQLKAAFDANGHPVTLEGGQVLNLFATFHPAAVLRDQPRIYAVADHLALLADFLDGTMVSPSKPQLCGLFAPR